MPTIAHKRSIRVPGNVIALNVAQATGMLLWRNSVALTGLNPTTNWFVQKQRGSYSSDYARDDYARDDYAQDEPNYIWASEP